LGKSTREVAREVRDRGLVLCGGLGTLLLLTLALSRRLLGLLRRDIAPLLWSRCPDNGRVSRRLRRSKDRLLLDTQILDIVSPKYYLPELLFRGCDLVNTAAPAFGAKALDILERDSRIFGVDVDEGANVAIVGLADERYARAKVPLRHGEGGVSGWFTEHGRVSSCG